jgi:opacity protein-like surface antigen
MKKSSCFTYYFLLAWSTLVVNVMAAQPQLSSQAAPSSFSNQWRVGFGLAVEYLNVEAKLKLQPDRGLEDPFAGQNIGNQQSQTGKHFQIAPCLELGNTFGNNYYLGLIASWRHSGLKSGASSAIISLQHFEHEFKLNYYANILIKAGYKVSPKIMVYGLIGPSIANWTHNSNQLEDNQNIVDKFKINKTSVGLGLGVGVEFYAQKDYAFSIDYTHHLHSSVSKSHSMSYLVQVVGGQNLNSGELKKKIDLSYGTIAIRFTKFFSL